MSKIKINQIFYNLKIEKLSYEFFGSIKLLNKTILIENVLENEIVDIKINMVNSKYALAEVINYHTYSPIRISKLNNASSPLNIIHYDNQIIFKEKMIKELFTRNLNFENIEKMVPTNNNFNYRNKLKFFVKLENNIFTFGHHLQKTNKFQKEENFILANNKINNLINIIKLKLNEIVNKKDIFEYITIYKSNFNDHFQILFSVKQKLNEEYINKIMELINHKVILIALKNKNNFLDIVYQDKKKHFLQKINNLKFILSLESFFQVNDYQIVPLYEILKNNLNLSINDVLLDAYCGVGAISLYISNLVKYVYGIEIVKKAVENAKINKIINNIKNVDFYTGDLEKQFNWKQFNYPINKVIVDPPRSGLSNLLIEKIILLRPKLIGYVSCNIHTLIRDLKIFINNDYVIKKVIPVDMFPQTPHVEIVVILQDKKT
ncbi:23S rRNA (uracil(1939)-C(5))-methyltransferase RlmD [Mycoplasma sp. 1018B]|uniref:23S rRNA (uracil(1939)-C(5))-methyltransferase RlmD n=1 Tax=Mycoplasma sp. 1018B TaxID=2967302 RepID=UPI00211D0EA5|nr:23S rRNA (uracil(1939)-C(5))-methyltransferase RlmD [Mycoplasma sp. 1018B]UUM19331.1 23S rRNA (uracil(1939)-C(5))-methyltransferase RlmD [Mycoplasma sp. 1018B]